MPHIRSLMRSRLRPFLGLLAWMAFTTNSLFPGLLHRCDLDRAGTAAVEQHPASRGMAGMDMMGMEMAGMDPATHAHGSHGVPARDGQSLPGDCHCVGHSCCSALVAAPPLSVTLPGTVVTVPLVRTGFQPASPVTRPPFLLPQAQAPPVRA